MSQQSHDRLRRASVFYFLLLLLLSAVGGGGARRLGATATTGHVPSPILAHPLIVAPAAMAQATEVVALVKGVAELPCDVTTATEPATDDPVRLVLWYRIDSSTPIYSVDARDGADLGAAEQWSSGGDVLGQRATFRADRHPAVLFLTNVKPKDEGLYRCRVDFRLSQTRNALVNLTVIVPPKRPTIVTKEAMDAAASPPTAGSGGSSMRLSPPLIAGQSLSLSCETSGGKPLARLVWLRDGHVIDDSYVTTFESTVRNDLWLPALDRRDLDATLTCEASNSNLTQPLTTSVTIDLLLPVVSVQLVGADHPLSAGKEVTLTCIVQGSRPPPIVTWFIADRTLAETHAIPSSFFVSSSSAGKTRTAAVAKESPALNEDRSVIRFTASIDDAGKKLGCRARNANITAATATGAMSMASDTSSVGGMKEDTRVLVIHARPVVRLSLGSNLQADGIKEGDDVYFDCRASALPPVTRLDWYHNDKKLVHNISAGVITTNQSLVLQRVGRHSAGRYRCVAINREGDTESDIFHLDVKYAPVCRSGQHRVYGVARHEEARIVCELDANPSTAGVGGMHFRWLFNSSAGVIELPPSTWTTDGAGRSVARYLPNSDLDFGTLLCSASNSIGNQALPCLFHVIPADKPDAVSNCSIVSRPAAVSTATATSATSSSSSTQVDSTAAFQVACTEGFSGGLPQNFLLEIFFIPSAANSNSNNNNNWQLFGNQTSMKPVFNLRGLNPILTTTTDDGGGHYVAHVTAVNAKGRSDPVTVLLSLQQQQRLPTPPQTGHGGGIKGNSAGSSSGSSGNGKSEVSAAVPLDPPRPEPSASSGQISPLVAIITGALSALFLLGAVLSMALRLRCRGQGNFNLLSSLRMHSRSSRSSAASETTAVMPAGVSSNNCCGGSGTLTSTASNSRLTAGGGGEGGGTASSNGGHQHHCSSSSSSDTTALLLIKSQQLHKSITPTLLNAMDVATAASADDHNPDLILSNSSTNCYGTAVQEDDDLLQSAMILQLQLQQQQQQQSRAPATASAPPPAPLAAMLTDLPPQRAFSSTSASASSCAMMSNSSSGSNSANMMRQLNDAYHLHLHHHLPQQRQHLMSATLGRNVKNRWSEQQQEKRAAAAATAAVMMMDEGHHHGGGGDHFVNHSLLHVVSATLPRPPTHRGAAFTSSNNSSNSSSSKNKKESSV